MKPTILTFGEIIWDVYDDTKLIGGAGYNFASHCSKCGINSILISSVGNDDLGKNAIDYAKKFEINTSFVKTSNYKTGCCLVKLDENKVPTFNVLKDVAYDHISLSNSDLNQIKNLQPNALYFGTLIQRASESKQTLIKLLDNVNFQHIVCDINLRKDCYDYESIKLCLEKATILKLSDEEEPILRNLKLYDSNDTPKEILKELSKNFPNISIILLTCGKDGAYAYDTKNDLIVYEQAKKVVPVSSVGAGDSFLAAFVSSYLKGSSIQVSLDNAISLSAFVVSKADAIPIYNEETFPWLR